MKKTVCPYCGRTMIDDEYSIRHRCQFCKKFFDGWKEQLHDEVNEIFREIKEPNKVSP